MLAFDLAMLGFCACNHYVVLLYGLSEYPGPSTGPQWKAASSQEICYKGCSLGLPEWPHANVLGRTNH